MPDQPADTARYRIAHVDQIPTRPREFTTAERKPVRHYFDIGSFGVNLYIARRPGELLVKIHTEEDTSHEELFFVAHGRARFSVDGLDVEAPAGTFVYVREPVVSRGAWADEAQTVLLVLGGQPGVAYSVQQWELDQFGPKG